MFHFRLLFTAKELRLLLSERMMFSIKEPAGKVLEVVAVGPLAPPATWLLCAAAFQLGICSACPAVLGSPGAEQQDQKPPVSGPGPASRDEPAPASSAPGSVGI